MLSRAELIPEGELVPPELLLLESGHSDGGCDLCGLFILKTKKTILMISTCYKVRGHSICESLNIRTRNMNKLKTPTDLFIVNIMLLF